MALKDSGRSRWDFYKQVKIGNTFECWLWQGSRTKNNYGRFFAEKRHWKAHRLAWEYTNGPILEEKQNYNDFPIMHMCNNPPCCNPFHLQLGTKSQNFRMSTKVGRYTRDSKLPKIDLDKILAQHKR